MLQPVVVASLGFSLIAAFGVLGVVTSLRPEFGSGLFDLDGEFRLYAILHGEAGRLESYNVPTLYSSALSAFAAVVAATLGRAEGVHLVRWFIFTGVLAHMAIDELLQIHERLERLSGVSWQTLYIPMFVLAAVVWWRVMRQLEPKARVLLMLGAAMWAVSQSLEHMEWLAEGRRAPHYNVMMAPEELMEMIGSLLFLLAMLVARETLLLERGNHQRGNVTKAKV